LSKKGKFKNNVFESIHKSAIALPVVGAIDKATMKEFFIGMKFCII
jgi:hypothetical protein